MTDYDFRFERHDDGVALLTLDRPDSLNSLTFEIYAQLERLFVDLETDRDVRAVVLTGAGKGFCSGGHVEDIIAQLFERDVADTLAFTRMTGAVVRNMRRLSKPIVAAVNGTAAGGGFSLALAGDYIFAAESAKFISAYTASGLTPDGSSTYHLAKHVGLLRAKELILTNRLLSAEEACAWGLVSKVVPDDQLMEEAMGLARAFAVVGAVALAMVAPRLRELGTPAAARRTIHVAEGIALRMEGSTP